MRASLTAFLHRGLSPHQFTPMSGAHHPAAGKAGIARLLAMEHRCPGLPEPER